MITVLPQEHCIPQLQPLFCLLLQVGNHLGLSTDSHVQLEGPSGPFYRKDRSYSATCNCPSQPAGARDVQKKMPSWARGQELRDVKGRQCYRGPGPILSH